jgi:hypothetical protein
VPPTAMASANRTEPSSERPSETFTTRMVTADEADGRSHHKKGDHGGSLVNNHWPTVPQRHALDIVQVRNGASCRGDKNELTSFQPPQFERRQIFSAPR